MTRAVYVDGARVELAPHALVGQGGEAEVYDLGDDRVVKVWKQPDHPDYAGAPAAQAAAAARLATAPAKLRALPGGLPASVVAPAGFALAARGQAAAVVGYAMPKIAAAEPLMALGEVRWRRAHAATFTAGDALAALLALHDAIAALHRARVVIGDCNDLNILVDPQAPARVHLIDVDSYQLPGFPCPMFSERFVDPRLCPPDALVPARPHDADSDWYAFAAMAFRTLLHVAPFAGAHPKLGTAAQRTLARISVLAPGVTYPRAARPLATLPDDTLAVFRAIFEGDQRGPFPRAALADLRFRRCPACGDEHARPRCPSCATALPPPPVTVHGRLRYRAIAAAEIAFATRAVGPATPAPAAVYLDQAALWRTTRLGPERIGGVLAHGTRAWVAAALGVGIYRAGGFAVGFVFRPDRGGLDDRVALPPLRGQLVDAHAAIGADRAFVFLTCADAGRLVTTALAISQHAEVLACETLADTRWLAGVHGACVAGPHLFVPTDEGIARIEVDAATKTFAHTRTFAETAALVDHTAHLALSPDGGIDALRAHDAIRLHLR